MKCESKTSVGDLIGFNQYLLAKAEALPHTNSWGKAPHALLDIFQTIIYIQKMFVDH